MPVGLVCALGTALCYGVGSVLQAAAAAQAEPVGHLDPRLVMRLARNWRYSLGLGLDALGFLLSLVALRSLPLYVVQSVSAGFLAVTAVAGALFLGLRMRRLEVVALGAVVLGLTLVGLSAAPESAAVVGESTQWLVLAAAVVLVAAAVPSVRVSGREGAWALGGAAGLAFGVVAMAARLLSASVSGGRLVDDVQVLVSAPAFYGLLVATPLALVAYATALQRGTVVQATAPLVVGETVLPALAGLALLGDHPRQGWDGLAALGFAIAVGATLLLSRFGEVGTDRAGAAEETSRRSSA
jgi:drug/metabolite transporter (DMT)-like permease